MAEEEDLYNAVTRLRHARQPEVFVVASCIAWGAVVTASLTYTAGHTGYAVIAAAVAVLTFIVYQVIPTTTNPSANA